MCHVALQVFKKLLGAPRPDDTCLTTNGMPSSHSIISTGMLVWLVLEVTRRDLAPAGRRSGCVVALTLALLPVMPSRHALADHSFNQCAAGGLIGAVGGFTHFWLRGRAVETTSTAAPVHPRRDAVKSVRLSEVRATRPGETGRRGDGESACTLAKPSAGAETRYALRGRTPR